MEYKSALKRKEMWTHATTWMNLEDIMLSKAVTKGQILCDYIFRTRAVRSTEAQGRMVGTRG
jgi:hypothetical protein